MLLSAGSDVLARDAIQWSALHLIESRLEDETVLNVLRRWGVDMNAKINNGLLPVCVCVCVCMWVGEYEAFYLSLPC